MTTRTPTTTHDTVRIDKWLWAARFFKTRSLASIAIDAGHVRRSNSTETMTGNRIKPAAAVRIGDCYVIQRNDMRQEIIVTVLSERRSSATEAALLYQETSASIASRMNRQALLTSNQLPVLRGRPTKHNRRKLAELFASNYHANNGTLRENENP